MSLVVVAMLVLLAIALLSVLGPPLLRLFGSFGVLYSVDMRPRALLVRPGGSMTLVRLSFDDGGFDLRGTLLDANQAVDPLPSVLVPMDSAVGMRIAGFPEPDEQPSKPLLTTVREWGGVVVSVLVLVLALWVITRGGFSVDDKKAAWAALTSILGFWVGKAT